MGDRGQTMEMIVDGDDGNTRFVRWIQWTDGYTLNNSIIITNYAADIGISTIRCEEKTFHEY